MKLPELFSSIHRQQKMLPKIKGLEQVSLGDMAVFGAIMKNLPEKDSKAVAMGTLHRYLRMSPPALSQSINRLEDKGLVERIFSKENRRMTYVAFTEEGKRSITANGCAWTPLVKNSGTHGKGSQRINSFDQSFP